MPQDKINKPGQPLFFLLTDGVIAHTGYNDTNQVTTSSFDTLISDPDVDVFRSKIIPYVQLLPIRPENDDDAGLNQAYNDHGNPVIIRHS